MWHLRLCIPMFKKGEFLLVFHRVTNLPTKLSFQANGEALAIKCVDKSKLSKTAVDNIITEIRLLKALKHPHIVEMKEFLWDEK